MSLRVKHLNADTSWLLTFSPPCAGANLNGTFPGTFTILVDPWLIGPSKIWSSRFALTTHKFPACISSLEELPEPDVILISQDKTDHCNEATLKQLSPSTTASIVAPLGATKKIKSWKHFNPHNIHALKKFDSSRDDSLFRIEIPAFSPTGAPGEVTIALITNKMDVTGLHNAIGLTYRPPSSPLTFQTASYVNLPLTPPTTPPSSPESTRSLSSSIMTSKPMTVHPSPLRNREKTVSIIYSPHGLSWNAIKPYASSHLLNNSALPLTALLHCFDRASNPWYLGGTVCSGFPNGVEIAEALCAKTWISAHDEDKEHSGVSTMSLKVEKYGLEDIKRQIDLKTNPDGTRSLCCNTDVIELGVGQDYTMPGK